MSTLDAGAIMDLLLESGFSDAKAIVATLLEGCMLLHNMQGAHDGPDSRYHAWMAGLEEWQARFEVLAETTSAPVGEQKETKP